MSKYLRLAKVQAHDDDIKCIGPGPNHTQAKLGFTASLSVGLTCVCQVIVTKRDVERMTQTLLVAQQVVTHRHHTKVCCPMGPNWGYHKPLASFFILR